MEAWKSGKDFEQALHKISEQLVYLRPSWYCILAGMGIFPDQLKTVDKVAPTDQAIDFCAQVAKKYFIDHLTQLEKLNA